MAGDELIVSGQGEMEGTMLRLTSGGNVEVESGGGCWRDFGEIAVVVGGSVGEWDDEVWKFVVVGY